MAEFIVCTVALRSELAQVRVLARSLGAQDAAQVQVLLADDPDRAIGDDASEPYEVLHPEDLGVDPSELHVAALHLAPTELTAALKPALILSALKGGAQAAIYLDPFTEVFASLAPLASELGDHPITLFPNAGQLDGPSLLPSRDGEPSIASGWYPGFIAVGPGAVAKLEWWNQNVGFHSVYDVGRAARRRVDWVDLAPGYLEARADEDPGYAVGYWNAESRGLAWSGDHFSVGDNPLVTFHFKGFDPNRPWVLSRDQGDRPRVLLSQHPELERLCRRYARSVIEAGYEDDLRRGYGWATLPDGNPVTRRIREAVRLAVEGSEEGLGYEPPPDPFDPATLAEFYRWLASPETENERAPAIARFFYPIYRSRLDLQQAFPDIAVVDAGRFREWAQHHAHEEYQVPDQIRREAFEAARWLPLEGFGWAEPAALETGLLVAGYLGAELGIGDAARRALQSMRAASLPCSAFAFAVTQSRRGHAIDSAPTLTNLDTNVIWVNPDQLGYLIRLVGADFFAGRYNVGCWAWETERMPVEMGRMARFVDEIWVPSEFTAAAVRPVVDKPVFVFEHPVTAPVVDDSIDPRRFGMPEGFVYLFMFDFLSTIGRKNPLGLVDAFCRAFRPGEGPQLVLKAINGGRLPLDSERLRLAIGDRPDILLIDRYLSAPECTAMLGRADCYVSLHRAEGFGLTIAESMALGKPVIATGYSGNLTFMDDETAYLVPAHPTPVGPDSPPYPPDGIWGEPDLEVAAEYLRRVYDDRDEAARKAALGREVVLSEHGERRAGGFLAERYGAIHQGKRKRGVGFQSPVASAVREALATPHWAGQIPGSVPPSADP